MRKTADGERERLASWKAIADFLGRDERTVQRWEKEHQLPIHRLPGERGGVFAFKDELMHWLNQEDSARNKVPVTHSTHQGIFWVGIAACSLLVVVAATLGIHAYRSRNHTLPDIKPAAEALQTQNSRAKELYLSGRFLANQRSRESLVQAAEAFTKAIHEDPQFGNAYSGLAETYELMPEFGAMPSAVAFPQALVAAKQAVVLAPKSPDAHRVLAFVLFYWEWRTDSASAEFERAIALDPRNARTHHWYANALLAIQRFDEAAKEIQIARELDPTSKAILADRLLIEAVRHPGDEQYITQLQDLSRSEPTFISPMRYLSLLLYDDKQYARWVDELQTIASTTHDQIDISIARAAKSAWPKGERTLLLNVLKTEENAQGSAQVSNVDLALLCLRIGNLPKALHFLHAAYVEHDFRLLVLVTEPASPLLKGVPEYEEIHNQIRATMAS